MSLQELAVQIRKTNDANGFDAPDWDGLLGKLMLAVTELDEARAAVRGTGNDPFAEELADTAIRLLDILNSIWGNDWADRRMLEPFGNGTVFEPVETLLWKPLAAICMAAESWRYEKRDDTRIAIELALRETFRIAARLNIDLSGEMYRKVERNGKRGHLHGKARADG